ncbi:MAG: 7TM diverse intracellular signaling domain-containing protein [Bacteroidales bacterium]
MKIRKTSIIFFGLLIAIAFIFTIKLTLTELEECSAIPSQDTNGVIDLTNVDFNKTKLIGLVGDYEFYWNQLLKPNDFIDSTKKTLTSYIKLPNIWNGYKVDSIELKGEGYATFRLKILFPDEDFYSIKVNEFDCAYKLWINGKIIESGKVGRNSNEEIPSWKRNTVSFFTKEKTAEFVLQVSNFNHRKGGPEDLMLIGKSDSVNYYKAKQISLAFFLIGLFFIMFVYNYVLYIYRRKEKQYLLFSLICFVILLRIISTGEKTIYLIFPNINWEIMVRIEYLSFILAIPLQYMFVRRLYPNDLSKVHEQIINITSGIVIACILLTPVKIFSYTPILHQGIGVFAATLIFVGLLKAVNKKRDDVILMLFGYFILFVTSINDILFYNQILNTTFLMPFGLFIIVFVNAIILSKRYSISFSTIETLTQELKSINTELEKKVEERTQEVLFQKSEIEKQAQILKVTNEKILNLSKFKDRITHMIVHDLKNPLSVITNVSLMKDIPEKDMIIHEAGREMNNLVMNMLDVYKYENTTMHLSKIDIYLKELIEDAINDIQLLAKMRNIVFKITVIENIKIEVDKSIMHRVLVNIITNAIKFSPIAGIIEIYTEIDPKLIKISVKDNGSGISADRIKTIFNRFQSGEQTYNLVASTGLGLNFCKLAIQSHGGSISVESSEMQGSTFTISLPL